MGRPDVLVNRIVQVGVRLAPYWVAHAVIVLIAARAFGARGPVMLLACWASYPFLLLAHLYARHRFGHRIWTATPRNAADVA